MNKGKPNQQLQQRQGQRSKSNNNKAVRPNINEMQVQIAQQQNQIISLEKSNGEMSERVNQLNNKLDRLIQEIQSFGRKVGMMSSDTLNNNAGQPQQIILNPPTSAVASLTGVPTQILQQSNEAIIDGGANQVNLNVQKRTIQRTTKPIARKNKCSRLCPFF